MHAENNTKNVSVLITGGAGFIGSAYVRMALSGQIHTMNLDKLIVLDSLTYAGDQRRFENFDSDPRFLFVKGSINNQELLEKYIPQVDSIIHFAAESHVDRSIYSGDLFVETNVIGTHNLVKAAMLHNKKILIVSTDEVYGSIHKGKTDEGATLNPSSVYSATKASADLLAKSYFITHGLDVRITRCANNYGKYQNKEKFIPTVISKIKLNHEIPIYGNGLNIREWLHTDDHCNAIYSVLENGTPGGIYNISGGESYSNLEIINIISDKIGHGRNLIKFIPDRLGHDFRYAVNDRKLVEELNWSRSKNLKDSLDEIILHELI